MVRWITTILASLLFLSTQSLAAEEDDSAIDSQAADLVMASAKFLATQPALSLGWFVSYDEVVDDNEKITYLRSGTTLMSRADGFASFTEREDTLRDYYWNGSLFTVVSPNEQFYSSAEFTGDFDALVTKVREQTGSVLPMWSILSETLPDNLMTDVKGAAYIGATLIAGQTAHHIALAEENEDWQIWISTDEDRPLPLMIVGTDRTKTGWPQYRVYMTNWNLEPDVDPAQFTYEPDENAVKIALPAVNALAKPAE